VLITVYTSRGDPVSPLLRCTAVFASTTGFPWTFTSVGEYQSVPYFPRGGTQWHTFAPYALPHQKPFCQTASLLPSVTQQEHVMEYQWEGCPSTAIPPTSVSNVVDQHRKTGGITFRADVSAAW